MWAFSGGENLEFMRVLLFHILLQLTVVWPQATVSNGDRIVGHSEGKTKSGQAPNTVSPFPCRSQENAQQKQKLHSVSARRGPTLSTHTHTHTPSAHARTHTTHSHIHTSHSHKYTYPNIYLHHKVTYTHHTHMPHTYKPHTYTKHLHICTHTVYIDTSHSHTHT